MRGILIAGALALASPALADDCMGPATATHTLDGVTIDQATGVVEIVVCPTSDAELSDPAYNGSGTVLVRVLHTAWSTPGDIIAAAAEVQAATPGMQTPPAHMSTAVSTDGMVQTAPLVGVNLSPGNLSASVNVGQ